TFGAEFHFWLLGLFGAAIGFTGLTLYRVLRRNERGRRGSVWLVGAAGHTYSAFPDVLFITAGVLHAYWMDAFAIHVSVHFIPDPLATMWAVFAVTLAAYAAAELDRRVLALGLVAVAVAGVLVALALRDPVPHTLARVRGRPGL